MATRALPSPSHYHRADASLQTGRYMYGAFDIDFTTPPAYRQSRTDFSVASGIIICEARVVDVDVATMSAHRLAVPLVGERDEGATLWLWAGSLIVFACALGGLSFFIEIPLADQISPTAGFLGIMLLILTTERGAG